MTESKTAPDEQTKKYQEDAENLKDADPNDVKYPEFKDFSKEDKANLFEAFKAIDADQNWRLSTDELQVFMNECNLDSTFTELIMRIIDKDDDKMVVFSEFLSFIDLLKKVQSDSKVLFKMLFNAIDKDGNGYLDQKEIGEFVNLFSGDQNKVNEGEIESFLEDFGTDNSNEKGKVLTLKNLEDILQ